MKEFTEEELAQYNGKNGNPVYVAYKGKVYDVSASFLWKDGSPPSSSQRWRGFDGCLRASSTRWRCPRKISCSWYPAWCACARKSECLRQGRLNPGERVLICGNVFRGRFCPYMVNDGNLCSLRLVFVVCMCAGTRVLQNLLGVFVRCFKVDG